MPVFTGPKFELLTPRQREVLQLLAEGNTEIETAAKLGIDKHTVGKHVADLKERLGARTLIQAFVIAMGV